MVPGFLERVGAYTPKAATPTSRWSHVAIASHSHQYKSLQLLRKAPELGFSEVLLQRGRIVPVLGDPRHPQMSAECGRCCLEWKREEIPPLRGSCARPCALSNQDLPEISPSKGSGWLQH